MVIGIVIVTFWGSNVLARHLESGIYACCDASSRLTFCKGLFSLALALR